MIEPHHSYNAGNAQKLAIMGGAYGNVPALRAAIELANGELGCDGFVFLGDAPGCCGYSDETAELIRQHFPWRVAGNLEQNAASKSDDCGCNYSCGEDERLGSMAHRFAMNSLSETNREWFGTWPDLALLETSAGRIILSHGSPDQTNEFLWESELNDARLNHWLEQAEAIGMFCTHSGFHWVRHLESGRFAANCGVIGKPDHDSDPAVHFATLDLRTGTVAIERVAYDHESWADQLEKDGVDPIFIEPLRTGLWTSGLQSAPSKERKPRPSK